MPDNTPTSTPTSELYNNTDTYSDTAFCIRQTAMQHFASLAMDLGFGDDHALLSEYKKHQSQMNKYIRTGLTSRVQVLYTDMVPGSWGHFFAVCFRSLVAKADNLIESDYIFTHLELIEQACRDFKADHLLPLTFSLPVVDGVSGP